jgi:manganese/zinc/iron transport system permease protein
MAAVTAVIALLTVVFWRPLKLSTFDEGFASTVGIPTALLSFALALAAAVAAVAAFDAVGSIIVIAMFICPPGAARLMTNRLEVQVLWSVVFAAFSAVTGYVLAGYGPLWLGANHAVSAAGMIATVSGVILGLACLFAPHRARIGVPRDA